MYQYGIVGGIDRVPHPEVSGICRRFLALIQLSLTTLQLLRLTVWIQSNWPVNKVKIDVIESQIAEAFVQSLFHFSVVSTPKFGGNEYIFSLHHALIECCL